MCGSPFDLVWKEWEREAPLCCCPMHQMQQYDWKRPMQQSQFDLSVDETTALARR